MEGKRACPYCAEPIAAEAIKCRYCGEMLPGAPAPPPPPLAPVDKDAEHLRFLSIGHYVIGGITALFSCFALIHALIGILVIVAPEKMTSASSSGPPPALFGWLFALVGGIFVLGGWTVAFCMILAGRSIAKRKRHLFCLIVAGLSCPFMPFGTALGILSFVVLLRPSVTALFDGENAHVQSCVSNLNLQRE